MTIIISNFLAECLFYKGSSLKAGIEEFLKISVKIKISLIIGMSICDLLMGIDYFTMLLMHQCMMVVPWRQIKPSNKRNLRSVCSGKPPQITKITWQFSINFPNEKKTFIIMIKSADFFPFFFLILSGKFIQVARILLQKKENEL